jgi:hypothetical protein
MKNLFTKLVFGVFLLTSFSLNAQLDENAPHFTVKFASAFSSNSVLVNNTDQYQILDQNGRVIEYSADKWNGSSWVKGTKGTRTWNTEGSLLEELVLKYDSITNVWNNYSQKTFVYDPNNLPTLMKYQLWDLNTNTWLNAIEEKNTYNADKLKVAFQRKYFSGNDVNAEYISYSYDSMKRIKETIGYNESNGTSLPKHKEVYSYIGSNKDYDQILGFNESNGSWGSPVTRTTLTVSGDEKIYLYENGDNGQFFPGSRLTEVFTTNNTIVSRIAESYKINTNTWQLTEETTFERNPDLTMHHYQYSLNDNITNQMFVFVDVEYFYDIADINEQAVIPNFEVDIFPNPTSGFVQIKSNNLGNTNIRLMDLNGKLLKQDMIPGGNGLVSLENQAAGTYYIKLEQNGISRVFPIIKQ